MKTGHYLVLGFLLALFQWRAAWALSVVSDVDDTIKISHVNSPIDAIARLPSEHSFTGISDVYQGYVESGAVDHFYYLSGTAALLRHHVTEVLQKNDFPMGPLILRGLRDSFDVESYKLAALGKLFSETTDSFILIGDDTQKDPVVYAAIQAEYPARVARIYIHRITGKIFPPETEAMSGLTRFSTALDLATDGFKDGFLTLESVRATAQAILNERHTRRILPRYQICEPPEEVGSVSDTEVANLVLSAQSKVRSICKKMDLAESS